jgi:4-oxalocrotonate tautomerase
VAKALATDTDSKEKWSALASGTDSGHSKMPIVTIQVTREGTKPGSHAVTASEKAALIKGVSELLLNVLNKPLDSTFVIIEEVDMDNWGLGGLPVAKLRQQHHTKSE